MNLYEDLVWKVNNIGTQKLDSRWIGQDFLIGGSKKSYVAYSRWAMWAGGLELTSATDFQIFFTHDVTLKLAAWGQQRSPFLHVGYPELVSPMPCPGCLLRAGGPNLAGGGLLPWQLGCAEGALRDAYGWLV
ncbi:unnamed protein product [Prunus armeniaca]